MSADVIEIEMDEPPREASMGASRLQILQGRMVEWLCLTMDRFGVPGFIRDVELKDAVTGQHVKVKTGHLFTKISVDGRDYYFHRLSGRFDGTGSGCS